MQVLAAQSCPTLRPHGLQPARSSVCGILQALKNTGVGSHSLLQGIFVTQGLYLGLLPCRQIIYPLSHQGSPFTYMWNLKNKTSERIFNISKQKWTHRYREQSSGYGWGEGWGKATRGEEIKRYKL